MSTVQDNFANSKPLSGRTALITGAARSIGRAITEALARDGANIVAHYRSRQQEATELAQLLESRGSQVLTVPGDLTEPETVSKLFDAAVERFGGIDVVVANAGRSGATKPVADITDEEYDGLQAVNNRAVFLVLREASRRIRDGGRIINISSSTTAYPQAGYALYAASKVSSSMIVRILAAELGPRNITSNSLIVGPVASGFLSGDGAFEGGDGILDQLAKASPAGRLGTPGDAAAVAAFLARPEAGWINGQLLTVNGGATVLR
jgi:3-oxoacyl-[acyl-carrier protein] reductase